MVEQGTPEFDAVIAKMRPLLWVMEGTKRRHAPRGYGTVFRNRYGWTVQLQHNNRTYYRTAHTREEAEAKLIALQADLAWADSASTKATTAWLRQCVLGCEPQPMDCHVATQQSQVPGIRPHPGGS
jgi:hypothetical protein